MNAVRLPRAMLPFVLVLPTVTVLAGCGSGGGGGSDPIPPSPVARSIQVVGGPGDDYAETGDAYADGSTLIAGEFATGAVFGRGEANETTPPSGGIFVARHASDGTLAWVRPIAAPGGSWVSGASALADGGALVTGVFFGTVVLAEGLPEETSFDSVSTDACFVARYDAAGTLVWATFFHGGVFGGSPVRLASGDILVAGTVHGAATFGTGGSAISVDTGGPRQAYLVWLDGGTGAVKDDAVFAATGASTADGLHAFENGDWAFAITFSGTVEVTFDVKDVPSFTSAGGSDVLLMHFGSGALRWARRLGGPADDWIDALAATPAGEIALAGPLFGSMTFDGAVADAASLSTSASNAQYLCRYSDAGDVLWARVATSSSDTLRNPGLAEAPDGTLMLATTTWAPATVDPSGPAPASLAAPTDGSSDAVVECWDPAGTLVSVGCLGVLDLQQSGSVISRPDGSFTVLGVTTGAVTYDPAGPHQVSAPGAFGQADFFLLDLAPRLP